jgi:hypothetical protein
VIDSQLEQVVQVRDCAIWDRVEILELNRIEGANNPGGSFLSAEGVTSTSQKIEALPLDQAIPDNVSFVKIDIEGAEYNAFYGSEKFKSFRPLVLSEIHATQLRKVSRITPDGYIGFLASLGYDCFSLMPHNYGQRIPRWTEGERIASVAFVPSNRSVTF